MIDEGVPPAVNALNIAYDERSPTRNEPMNRS
jgi:hypothetical protein